MRDFFKRLLRLVAVLSTLPLTFFGVLFGWHLNDVSVGYREVTAFIEHHEPIMEEWRENPRIHSVSLSHDPNQPGALLIEFDVDDKRTFLMLEDDLFVGTSGMRIPPNWNTKLRSNEDLGNNWGFAGVGIGEALNGIDRLAIAVMASLIMSAISLWLAFRTRIRKRPEPPTGVSC